MTSGPTTSNGLMAMTEDGFGGTLLAPDDASFDDLRRLDNALIDPVPLAIARCRSADDVAAVVRHARRDGRDITVRSGGPGVVGNAVADGAICIDLREMSTIEVDPTARTARVGAGVIWRDLDSATQQHGLAVTGARISSLGVAGLALGSGSGWLERAIGATSDNLRSADVVTVDGRVVRASEREHPGLLWGLRGGAGNFGIVTAFEFALHPVGPTLQAGLLTYPADAAESVVRGYRDVMELAPDELCGGIVFRTARDCEGVASELRGRPVVSVIACYVGSPGSGDTALEPIRSLGRPAVGSVRPTRYIDVQRWFDAFAPTDGCHYWSADFLTGLPDDAVTALSQQATRPVSAESTVLLAPCGGALGRVDRNATALGERAAAWTVHHLSTWSDPALSPGNVSHNRAISAALTPWATGRTSVDYLGPERRGRVTAAYGPAQYARLAALKKTWDPDNVLRHTANIPPA